MPKKLPALHIYPGDLLKDPAFRLCSWQAQNLWLRMLVHLHDMPHRGRFVLADGITPLSEEQITKILDMPLTDFRVLLQQLVNNGVTSIDNNVITNRRMVREAQVSDSKSKAGKKGMASRYQSPNRKVYQDPNTALTENTTYSSSSSSSSSVLKKEEEEEEGRPKTNRKGTPPRRVIPDEEWLKSLESEPVYAGLNILQQFQLCLMHFKAKNQTVSRQRFLNWLGIEVRKTAHQRPMHISIPPSSCQARVKREGFITLQPCGKPSMSQPESQKPRAICQEHYNEEAARIARKQIKPQEGLL